MERSRRLARGFKGTILAVTSLLALLLLTTSPHGRNLGRWAATRTRWAALRVVGSRPSRADLDADWTRRRLHDIETTRGKLRDVYAEYAPPMRRLLDYAGLSPDTALLRWGNFDRTLYLPATVFEADDTGRSYRFRPNTSAIWVRNLRLKGGILAYFPVPTGPALAPLAQETGAQVVAGSVQLTNSWGLRGPEPDLEAPLRGIVLGDSYMQGLFVGDHETPVECLKRRLSRELTVRTEILNTGHLGYSPEQEYFTLREYAERFPPAFVVLSLFANDFGDLFEVLEGHGDWDEGKYWIGRITEFCKNRGITFLAVPAPWVNQIDGPRRSGFYPGLISNLMEGGGLNYLDPADEFVNETLREQARRRLENQPVTPNPLFNGLLADGHFSPIGCELWARVVCARLVLLLNANSQNGRDGG